MLPGPASSQAIAMRPRTAFLRAAESRAVPLAGSLLLGPAARGGMGGGQADVGWGFSGVFRLDAAFGATRPSTCLGALPIVSTAEARAAEGASPKVTWPHSLLVADLVLSL